MTDELKTIKDLAFVWDNDEPEYVKCPELKAEAIKRAKYFFVMREQAKSTERKQYWNGRLIEVLEFNNLEEGDYLTEFVDFILKEDLEDEEK